MGGYNNFPIPVGHCKFIQTFSRSAFQFIFTSKAFTLMNYKNAFSNLNVLQAYKTSILISGSVTIGVMLLSTMMAFAITRYNF